MAAAGGPAPHPIEQSLRENPARFGFYQAVRKLECAYAGESRVGKSEHPREDPVRFCQATSLAFAPSTVSRYVPASEDHPARLFVSFMGMLGPNGPMPLTFAEYVYDRIHNHEDRTLARFLDLFNHRMISLFYRAWAGSQQAVSRDSPGEGNYDRFVGSLVGIGMPSFLKGDDIPDETKLHYAGHLSCQTKHAEGLESILREYFGVPAEVVGLVGRWMPIPGDRRCHLGRHPDTGTLGVTALLGSSIWECQQKFRIRLGPMKLTDYERLLPRTRSFNRLTDWVRNCVGDELLWDVQIIVKAEEVPRTNLGVYGRLGWTTWLQSLPREDDATDLVIDESGIESLRQERTRGLADARD